MQILGKIQRWILESLEESGDLAAAFFLSAGNSKLLFSKSSKYQRQRERIARSLKRLQEKNLIKFLEENDPVKFHITDIGKKFLSKNSRKFELKKLKQWDGKWRLIMFDIPERKKKARRAFSSMIQEIGAATLQKSVFVYPFPCENEIRDLAEIYEVSPWVLFAEADRIDKESKLKQFFGL